jgi:hypothetical protein
MEKSVTFTVPAGLQRTEMIIDLNRRIKATGKNIQIHAYDTVQGLQWNGGRLMFNGEFIKDEKSPWHSALTMKQVDLAVERAKTLNREGIPFNLVFNSTLNSIDLDDEVGNHLLNELHDEMNGVTIASRAMKQHVSAHFPKYEITASICHVFNEPEQYAQACQEYDKVVVLPKFAYAMDRLEGVPLEKLVFIVNDQCFLLCLRKDHYDAISRCYLGGNNTRHEQERNVPKGDCFMKNPKYRERVFKENDYQFASTVERAMITQRKQDGLGPKDMEFDFNITPSTRKELIQRGIRNFKLQGRDYNEADYQKKVTGFLEKMVRDEL